MTNSLADHRRYLAVRIEDGTYRLYDTIARKLGDSHEGFPAHTDRDAAERLAAHLSSARP